MVWFDKLKEFIKVDLKIDLHQLFYINLNKNSNTSPKLDKEYYYDTIKKILHLDPDKIPENIKKELPNIIKAYVEEGNKLLEYDANELLDKLYNYNKENPDGAILSFFKPIIPPKDFEALNASLFLRQQFMKDKAIHHLKQDIRKRFGDTGNNISNLCTAGYFEEFLMPLFNSSQEDFKRVYNHIVEKSIVAVFVHRNMNVEDIPKEITNRIEISKKYGIKFIHIHGISKNNVEKIKSCIEEQKSYFDFFDKKIFENEDKNIIVVELLFK